MKTLRDAWSFRMFLHGALGYTLILVAMRGSARGGDLSIGMKLHGGMSKESIFLGQFVPRRA